MVVSVRAWSEVGMTTKICTWNYIETPLENPSYTPGMHSRNCIAGIYCIRGSHVSAVKSTMTFASFSQLEVN